MASDGPDVEGDGFELDGFDELETLCETWLKPSNDADGGKQADNAKPSTSNNSQNNNQNKSRATKKARNRTATNPLEHCRVDTPYINSIAVYKGFGRSQSDKKANMKGNRYNLGKNAGWTERGVQDIMHEAKPGEKDSFYEQMKKECLIRELEKHNPANNGKERYPVNDGRFHQQLSMESMQEHPQTESEFDSQTLADVKEKQLNELKLAEMGIIIKQKMYQTRESPLLKNLLQESESLLEMSRRDMIDQEFKRRFATLEQSIEVPQKDICLGLNFDGDRSSSAPFTKYSKSQSNCKSKYESEGETSRCERIQCRESSQQSKLNDYSYSDNFGPEERSIEEASTSSSSGAKSSKWEFCEFGSIPPSFPDDPGQPAISSLIAVGRDMLVALDIANQLVKHYKIYLAGEWRSEFMSTLFIRKPFYMSEFNDSKLLVTKSENRLVVLNVSNVEGLWSYGEFRCRTQYYGISYISGDVAACACYKDSAIDFIRVTVDGIVVLKTCKVFSLGLEQLAVTHNEGNVVYIDRQLAGKIFLSCIDNTGNKLYRVRLRTPHRDVLNLACFKGYVYVFNKTSGTRLLFSARNGYYLGLIKFPHHSIPRPFAMCFNQKGNLFLGNDEYSDSNSNNTVTSHIKVFKLKH